MMSSVCCSARVFAAHSSGGWWIEGKVVYDWYECSQCKQPCDTVTALSLNINQSEGNENDQGCEESANSSV